MGAAAPFRLAHRTPGGGTLETTLLELVWAVSEVTESESELVATVAHLIHSGRVRLTGSFRGSLLSVA